jgi:aminopeptidase N
MPGLVVIVLALMVAGGGCDEPGAPSAALLPPAQAAYDVGHYDLDVRVRPEAETIAGTMRMQAAVGDTLRSVLLDLDDRLAVEGAWVDGEPVPSDSVTRPADGDRVRLLLGTTRMPGDTIGVRIAYRGSPRVAPNPPWDGGVTWGTTPEGAPWIGTSVQTAGASVWWPVKDHPSDEPDSMDIALTVPDSLVAASNGRLRAVERASDSTRTYRWHVSVPINTYNVTMNVAPYAHVDTTYQSTADDSVPVSFYALPSDSARAARVLPDFLDQLRFLEETLGPYPPRADKYGVAQAPFLGMEHQSLIAYGHDFSTGGLGYDAPFDALHFHELAHEWYGNLVTVDDWKDFWLHEGPATYLEALYAEHLRGDSAYHAVTDHFRSRVAGGVQIAREDPTPAAEMYHRDVYFRGAMLLHTLRYWVGEDAMRTLLRRFVYPGEAADDRRPPFRNVTTADFIETAEAVTGRSLDDFFQVYVYRAPLPRLETTQSGGTLQLQWVGTGDATLEVPVPVEVNGTLRRVAMEGGAGKINVPAEATVEVDPTGWLLRAK